jgi:hypothetical protein
MPITAMLRQSLHVGSKLRAHGTRTEQDFGKTLQSSLEKPCSFFIRALGEKDPKTLARLN